MVVILIYLFILGLFVGSFYNVVALRLSKNESIVFPGSHCVNCDHKLSWYELIPVFSYIGLRGKCKKCKISYLPNCIGAGSGLNLPPWAMVCHPLL